MITIFAEIYNLDQKEGIEYLTFSVRVAKDIDDHAPKYSYDGMREKDKALTLANKIHIDQRTQDLIHVTA